jgi:hypothetical protein
VTQVSALWYYLPAHSQWVQPFPKVEEVFLMQHKKLVACTSVVLALAVACSKNSETPVSPSAAQPGVSEAGPNGETLKASAPTPQSPIDNAQPDQLVFTAGKSTGTFDSALAAAFSYEFEVRNAANSSTVCSSGALGGGSGSSVTWTASGCTVEFDTAYTWRVRATHQGAFGPWSSAAAFRSPSGGYIRGNEVFDPLTNGRTVGEIVGSVTFLPGVGVRLNDFGSHIRYRLPQTLTTGEFSLITTNLATNTEGEKTKVFAMSEGLSDIVVNDRRFTVEKRGDPAGIVAWRFITRDTQIDTEGAERQVVQFDPAQAYLWTATWNGFFNVRIQRGGASGETIYSKGKPYQGVYDPDPHYAFIGAPSGRSGIVAASVPGVIVRNVWISPRPRPSGL